MTVTSDTDETSGLVWLITILSVLLYHLHYYFTLKKHKKMHLKTLAEQLQVCYNEENIIVKIVYIK